MQQIFEKHNKTNYETWSKSLEILINIKPTPVVSRPVDRRKNSVF